MLRGAYRDIPAEVRTYHIMLKDGDITSVCEMVGNYARVQSILDYRMASVIVVSFGSSFKALRSASEAPA
jgi:hypothetical protein